MNFHLKTKATLGAQLHTPWCSEGLQLLPGSSTILTTAVPSWHSYLRILLLLGFKWDGKVATGHVIWTLVCYCDLQTCFQIPKTRGFLPSMIPQGVFLPRTLLPFTWYSLSLPTTAKGMLSCWGETWKDPLNPFQRAAPPRFPIHLSSSQLNKHKAFSEGRDSPEQNFTGCPFHPSLLSLECLDSCFPGVLAPQQAHWVACSSAKGSGAGAELFCTSLQYF